MISVKSELWQRYDLPPPDTKRWVVSRKAAVVTAVNKGNVTRDYVLQLYKLSEEELDGWISRHKQFGPRALGSTVVQTYR